MLSPAASTEALTVSVAMHGCARRMHCRPGLTVPSAAPLFESVNLTFPSGPIRKPGRIVAVRVVDPDGSTTLGEAVTVVVVATRMSAMLGAAVAPSPAIAITVVLAMRTSRRPARVWCRCTGKPPRSAFSRDSLPADPYGTAVLSATRSVNRRPVDPRYRWDELCVAIRQSPPTDSSRRPLPYHGLTTAQTRERLIPSPRSLALFCGAVPATQHLCAPKFTNFSPKLPRRRPSMLHTRLYASGVGPLSGGRASSPTAAVPRCWTARPSSRSYVILSRVTACSLPVRTYSSPFLPSVVLDTRWRAARVPAP